MKHIQQYDVTIIGAGVSGTALAWILNNYTTITKTLLLEKHTDVAQVSSHYTQNSQTLHFGDIETNYTYEKAAQVNKKTKLVQGYIETIGKKEQIFTKSHKMAIGVGTEEVQGIQERVKNLKKTFPNIKLLNGKEIATYEPYVMKGRNKKEPIAALWSPDGYTMNFYNLAKSFIKHTNETKKTTDILLGTEVTAITPQKEGYLITTPKGTYFSRYVICDAGAMSIKFAKDLGHAQNLTVMSLAGNFFRGPEVLKGKVYTWQHPKRPNAAFHGDPDVVGKGYTRFGPTALILLMLERRNWKTVQDYFTSFDWSWKGWKSVFKVALDPDYFFYMLENYLIELPFIGRFIVAKKAQKIVPTLTWKDIRKDKGYGATRPQIINTETGTVQLGEARIEGKGIIFNVTPSPGASTCIANAVRDTQEIMNFFKKEFTFNEKKLMKDLTL